MNIDRLGFGVVGLPKGANKKDPVGAVKVVHSMGLDCLELEFAHGTRLKEDTAIEVQKTAKELGIILTAYAPYYINLNAKEQDKIDASINRLLQTAKLAGLCGAYSMTFHAAFYMKDDPKSVFEIVKKYLHQISDKLKQDSNLIHLRPELTGKKSQFGSLEELCLLSKEVSQVYPCLDFTQTPDDPTEDPNKDKDYNYFIQLFEQYKKALGKQALNQMHIRVGGIEIGGKGENKKIPITQSTFKYIDFLQACKDHGIKGSIIVDGPEKESDALLLKSTYQSLEKRKLNLKSKKQEIA
jgi:deoxyribonuclease-4